MDVYGGEFAVEHKDDKSPLTEADRRSHETILSILEAEIPEVPILSEEGATIPFRRRREWERYLLIDPLDGTKEFVKRNGEFTVNIALVERTLPAPDGTDHPRGNANANSGDRSASRNGAGEGARLRAVWVPVAGVVYAPDLQELFVGSSDGAWWWGGVAPAQRVGTDGGGTPVAAVPALDAAETIPRDAVRGGRPYTIVASRSHMSPETQAFVDERRAEHPDLDLVSAGSSLKLCRVADGTADEYPRFAPTMEWDTAAGDAVARAAGCEVSEWSASVGAVGPLEYNKEDLHNPWFLVRRVDGGVHRAVDSTGRSEERG